MKDLMAANWKMFKTIEQAAEFMQEFIDLIGDKMPANRDILIIPPFTALDSVQGARSGTGIHMGAQNFYPQTEGAFTGEISPQMLQDAGCTFALTGHSERRHIFKEDDELIGQKTRFGLDSGLKIILCIGEKLEERRQGQLENILRKQLTTALQGISQDRIAQNLVIAYEPVWAIGTGEVAGPTEIAAAHLFVRTVLTELFAEQGEKIRILYGGSVKPGNCAEIMALDNVCGVLVGGASLNAQSFAQIVMA